MAKERVNHPSHYGGKDNPYEAIKVIRAWNLGFSLGNTVKYISRAGKKTKSPIEDLEKAMWYLAEEIAHLREGRNANRKAIRKDHHVSRIGTRTHRVRRKGKS